MDWSENEDVKVKVPALPRLPEKKSIKEIPGPPAYVIELMKKETTDTGESVYDHCKKLSLKHPDVPEAMFQHVFYFGWTIGCLKDRHGHKWIPVVDVAKKYDISIKSLLQRACVELPVYMLTRDETFERVKEWCFDGPSYLWQLDYNWWFKRIDIEFYVRLHPDIFGPISDESSIWVTPESVTTEWKISAQEILDLVRTKGLTAYVETPQEGLRQILPGYVQSYGLRGCLFNIREFHRFLKDNPGLFGLRELRPKEKDEQLCRAYAEARWKDDPKIKINALAKEIRATLKLSTLWEESTIKHWIRGLSPDHKKNQKHTSPPEKRKGTSPKSGGGS